MRYLPAVLLISVFVCGFIGCANTNPDITYTLQKRDTETGSVILTKQSVSPAQTAIIVIDMWNGHYCKSSADRVVEMAPAMNALLHTAREQGMLIIHAPSGCMDYYADTEQRRYAETAPFVEAPITFQWNRFNPDREGYLEPRLEQGGCSCDGPVPCEKRKDAFDRQIGTLDIAAGDAISDTGQEIYNMLAQKNIALVIIMGVHTNVCVLGRPFGIRQMVYLGQDVVLCRDLTDSHHRDPGRHFEGLRDIVHHIETHWCPTITSDQITGGVPFRFKDDPVEKPV